MQQKVKKVGHAGTLDPLAEGLVLVAFGKKATKEINNLILLKKRYLAQFKLGATTKSYDSEFEEENIKDTSAVNLKIIQELIANNFIGEISQMPPDFSAKKINGTRAYNLARKEKEVKLNPVSVFIHNFDVISYDNPFVNVDIECSKGTYIRAIARDLGDELSCGGYMTKLLRTSIGDYKLENALSIDEFIGKINYDKSI